MKLDAFDRKILAALQRNGRLSNVELADEIGLSASPCLRRVRMLEEAGVIRGYQANLDRDEAARLLAQVDKMLDKDLDARLTFSGSNGNEQTDSLSTYRDWLQAKGGINTYA